MLNKNDLNSTLRQITGSVYKGNIGIELEVESNNDDYLPSFITKYWRATGEDSLRNGVEFITKSGLVYQTDNYGDCMLDLQHYLKTNADLIQSSIRTSTHVHISALGLTLYQIWCVVLNYYLFESLFVQRHGVYRKGNLFCQRFQDANGLTTSIEMFLTKYQGSVFEFNTDTYKYSALNLANLANLGTFEFRYMKALVNPNLIELNTNIDLLHNFVHTFKLINPLETVKDLDTYNSLTVLAKYFKSEHVKYCTENLTHSEIQKCTTVNLHEVEYLAKILEEVITKPKVLYSQYSFLRQEDDERYQSKYVLNTEVQPVTKYI